MVGSTAWSDLNKDGKRLERIIKDMDTKQKTELVPSMRFAYIDRLVKLTNLKIHVAETVLGVNALLKQAKAQGLTKPVSEVPQIIV